MLLNLTISYFLLTLIIISHGFLEAWNLAMTSLKHNTHIIIFIIITPQKASCVCISFLFPPAYHFSICLTHMYMQHVPMCPLSLFSFKMHFHDLFLELSLTSGGTGSNLVLGLQDVAFWDRYYTWESLTV